MNPFSNYKHNLDELVFEHKNKEYGAYVLRKTYSNRINSSLGLTLMPFVALLVFTLIKFPVKELPPFFPEPSIANPKAGDTFKDEIHLSSGFILELDPNTFRLVPDKKVTKPIEKKPQRRQVQKDSHPYRSRHQCLRRHPGLPFSRVWSLRQPKGIQSTIR